MIPYGRQDVTDADVQSVVEVLRSDFLTQGPIVPRFEEAVAQQVNARHAVAMNSATSALHVACASLDLGAGDRLWTVPNTFVASANCGLYCGATVDFVDIDASTWNMSVERLEDKLVLAKKAGTLPKIVVPVHFAGQPSALNQHQSTLEAHFRTHPPRTVADVYVTFKPRALWHESSMDELIPKMDSALAEIPGLGVQPSQGNQRLKEVWIQMDGL